MNKDAKIGLVVVLLLVVLLVIFWSRHTFWGKSAEDEVAAAALTPTAAALASATPALGAADTTGTVVAAITPADSLGQTDLTASSGPITRNADNVVIPPSTITAASTPLTRVQAEPTRAAVAASTYEVKSGDSLESIAKKLFNDGNKWRLIASANGITDPRKLRIGQKLKIPALPTALSAGMVPTAAVVLPVPPGPAVVATAVAVPPIDSVAGTAEAAKTYVVQKNDTLGAIAKKFYNDETKAGLIAKANHISDPKKLQIGQKLVIPPVAEPAPAVPLVPSAPAAPAATTAPVV